MLWLSTNRSPDDEKPTRHIEPVNHQTNRRPAWSKFKMHTCSSRQVLMIVHCLVVLSIGRFTFAQSSHDDQTQHDNSDATKAKKKLKGGKRAAGKSKHPGVTIGHALSIDFTGRIEGDLRQATPALGFDAM